MVIVEFPYLMKANPALPSILKQEIDLRGRTHRGTSQARLEDFDAWVVRSVLDRRRPLSREGRYLLSPAFAGGPRKVRSLGEAKWGKVMGLRHLDRLRLARDLLQAKGYDTSETVLACYGGAGFDEELTAAARSDARILLVDLPTLYGSTASR
ncbi:hypothetical protein [Nonomuraea glycinis]|uniref:hypothetical protein n=1 Tax=Nonomuraea glycinis TaxID=2047744 RepID=UPI0033A1B478